jgi:hypothetical protein
LAVFPLAVEGLTAVVKNKPRGISTGPVLSVPLPGIELGVPRIASQRELRLRYRSAGLSEPVKSLLDEVVNGDLESSRFCGEPAKGVFGNAEVGHLSLHRT